MSNFAGRDRPDLSRELVFRFGLLAAAALSLAVLSVIASAQLRSQYAWVFVLGFAILDGALVIWLGGRLIRRFVVQPMEALRSATEELSSGNLHHRAPASETRDFTELAEQFNYMTERLQDAQAQLVRAEKLASIGRLAAGIAHEVGNPLSAIGNYVDVLKKRGGDPEIVAALTREAGRIDKIVRGLLDYARPRSDVADNVDIAAVLRSALEILTHQGVLKDVTVSVETDSGTPKVRARVHDLEQVIVNLVLNAVDADPGGKIVVGVQSWRFEPRSTRQRRTDPGPWAKDRAAARVPFRPELADGTLGALLYVADSGPGVPVEAREQVFDPFYTTKPPGAGTGLGLAIVQRTVHELGGVIWVDEARGGGAAFKVFLPA